MSSFNVSIQLSVFKSKVPNFKVTTQLSTSKFSIQLVMMFARQSKSAVAWTWVKQLDARSGGLVSRTGVIAIELLLKLASQKRKVQAFFLSCLSSALDMWSCTWHLQPRPRSQCSLQM